MLRIYILQKLAKTRMVSDSRRKAFKDVKISLFWQTVPRADDSVTKNIPNTRFTHNTFTHNIFTHK